MGESRCVGVEVCGSFGVLESQCLGGAMCGRRYVWESQYGGVVMLGGCDVGRLPCGEVAREQLSVVTDQLFFSARE